MSEACADRAFSVRSFHGEDHLQGTFVERAVEEVSEFPIGGRIDDPAVPFKRVVDLGAPVVRHPQQRKARAGELGAVTFRAEEAPVVGQLEDHVHSNFRRARWEQARAALLSGNQRLYTQSLENTRRWLNEFFSLQESGVSALDAELAGLLTLSVGREFPDINDSLSALKTVVNARHMVEEGG